MQIPIQWAFLLLSLVAPTGANGADWFVAPAGASAAQGTKAAPWDIESALDGRQKIAPGDTLRLRGGTYKRPFELLGQGFAVQLASREEAPIRILPWNGERVTIEGGLSIQPPSTDPWIQDPEITVSQPRPAKPVLPDPTYRNTGRPWGGLNINTGAGCDYFHLSIHDNNQGVSFWHGATDSELSGEDDPRRKPTRVVLRPSKYDTRRAHLALLNGERKPVVEVNAAGFLKHGDRFRLMAPRDFYGRPVLTGRYNGRAIRVPVNGEFAAFVVLKDAHR